ncbi:hypothetical protein C8F01DRAFT_1134384, partial [Mycena amicta]
MPAGYLWPTHCRRCPIPNARPSCRCARPVCQMPHTGAVPQPAFKLGNFFLFSCAGPSSSGWFLSGALLGVACSSTRPASLAVHSPPALTCPGDGDPARSRIDPRLICATASRWHRDSYGVDSHARALCAQLHLEGWCLLDSPRGMVSVYGLPSSTIHAASSILSCDWRDGVHRLPSSTLSCMRYERCV